MKKYLKEIVKFNSGLIISRESSRMCTKRQYRALNYKSIDESGNICFDKLDALDLKDGIEDKFITQKNDLIIKLAYPFKAILINKKEEGILITSNFCKIMCLDEVLPEYLLVCLNSNKIDKKLKIESKNQIISQISIKDLKKIEIEIYDIKKQKIIADMYNMHLKRIKITKSILEKERKILKNIYQ